MSISILVVGSGAVGTMCAFALHKSGQATVTAVMRSNYDLAQARGVHITSVDHGVIEHWKPHHIAKTVTDAQKHGPYDYVLVALKNLPDVYSIPNILHPVITTGHTTIVLVQNGVDIEEPLHAAFPHNILLSAVTMIGAELNGCDLLHNDPDIMYLASYGSRSTPTEAVSAEKCAQFCSIYEAGGAKCQAVEDIAWHRWRKLVWNASFNTVCAVLNCDSGTVQDAGCMDTLIRPAMNEVVAIAKAAGHDLPEGIQDTMIKFTPKAEKLKPSMQVDAIRKRPMEIEVILGNPLRQASKLHVAAPTLSLLYNLLKAKQWTILNKQ